MARDLRFLDFAGGAVAGTVAGTIAAALARKAFDEPKHGDVAAGFARIGGFWIVGGIVWVLLARRE